MLCLNHDGACTDASLLACIGALRNLSLPATVEKVEEVGQSSRGIIIEINPLLPSKKLMLGDIIPLPVTYGRFEKTWIVDPTAEEERYAHPPPNHFDPI